MGACQEGHTSIIELLLQRGAQVEAKTNFGSTPLILASQQGEKSVVELLLNILLICISLPTQLCNNI